MSDFSYERLEQSIKNLKLDISIEELATLVNERSSLSLSIIYAASRLVIL